MLRHFEDHSVRPIPHVADLSGKVWKVGSTVVLSPTSCDSLLREVGKFPARNCPRSFHINPACYGIQDQAISDLSRQRSLLVARLDVSADANHPSGLPGSREASGKVADHLPYSRINHLI